MAWQGRGAVIVLDDGRSDTEDLLARVRDGFPEVYRLAADDIPDASTRVVPVGRKHVNVKTMARKMYEETIYASLVPAGGDPVVLLSDFLSEARGLLADGFPGFALISARPGVRYRRVAVLTDLHVPITTGALAVGAVGLAHRAGAPLDMLILGGDPENVPRNLRELREQMVVEEGADLLDQALLIAEETGIEINFRVLGEAAARDQLALDAVRDGGYDLVVDDLRPIDIGPRLGRLKRVRRRLNSGGSPDTAYRLLRDAPCDVAIIVDAVTMKMLPAAYLRAGAVAALSLGLLGVVARPAVAHSSATGPGTSATVEAPVDPADQSADAAAQAGSDAGSSADAQAGQSTQTDAQTQADAGAETDTSAETDTAAEQPGADAQAGADQAADADAQAQAQPDTDDDSTALVGTPAPDTDSIPEHVDADQQAAYEQALTEEAEELAVELATLGELQDEAAEADALEQLALADLTIAQQDLADAQATQHSTDEALDYAEGDRNTLTESEVAQAHGSANKAAYDVDRAEESVAEAEESFKEAAAEHEAAAGAVEEQEALVEAQMANVAAWDGVVTEADARTDQKVTPIEGGVITTAYGVGGSNWSSGYHTGSDFAAPTGTSVLAASSGTVTAAGWAGAYGNQITVQHPDGSETTYSHLSAIDVSVGQEVSAGEQIGLVGTTGNSTGPHLHFETFDPSGERVNPADWLAWQ